jgi:HSP20 family protein
MPLPSLIDEIDRLFDELVCRPWGGAARQLAAAEIRSVDDGWLVVLPVPGLEADDLEVEMSGRQLSVHGERRIQQEEGLTRTQKQLSLQRTFTLPAEADPAGIEASVEGSTLTIHIRKRQPWRKQVRTSKK